MRHWIRVTLNNDSVVSISPIITVKDDNVILKGVYIDYVMWVFKITNGESRLHMFSDLSLVRDKQDVDDIIRAINKEASR